MGMGMGIGLGLGATAGTPSRLPISPVKSLCESLCGDAHSPNCSCRAGRGSTAPARAGATGPFAAMDDELVTIKPRLLAYKAKNATAAATRASARVTSRARGGLGVGGTLGTRSLDLERQLRAKAKIKAKVTKRAAGAPKRKKRNKTPAQLPKVQSYSRV